MGKHAFRTYYNNIMVPYIARVPIIVYYKQRRRVRFENNNNAIRAIAGARDDENIRSASLKLPIEIRK